MRYTLYVVLAAVLWSTGGLGVKSVDVPPLALAGLRSAFAVPILLIALVLELKRNDRDVGSFVSSTVRRPLVWGAAASYAVMVVSFVVAAKLTTAANAILLQYTAPIYVALLSWPLLRERVSRTDIAVTVACLLGMVLFFFDRVSSAGHIGDGVAIVSSFGFAGVPLLMRLEHARGGAAAESRARTGPLATMVLGNALACLVCLPSVVSMTGPISTQGFATIAFLGVFQIGVAYVLYAAAVNVLPALRSTLIATIEPILNPLWVALVRGEMPSRFAAIGGGVILVSVTVQAITRRSRTD
jgi:drug/metabolite transporter (DMT)-like permease